MMFRTKPRGIHATFVFDCPRCRQEATVTGGRVDSHDCREPRPVTIWATHEEVEEGQKFYHDTMTRLKAALDRQEHR